MSSTGRSSPLAPSLPEPKLQLPPLVDVLLLGSGWTSTFLLPRLAAEKIAFSYTNRSGTKSAALPISQDAIEWTLPEPGQTKEQWASTLAVLPSARLIVVVMALKDEAVARELVLSYDSMMSARGYDRRTKWCMLGSTGIWGSGGSYTSSSPIDAPNARSASEDAVLSLLGERATVLNLAGLFGSARHPINWLAKVAGTRDKLSAKTSLHLVHGNDVVEAILSVWKQLPRSDGVWGKRWLVTDGRIYDWWQLVLDLPVPDDDHACYARWVEELQQEYDVEKLPRSIMGSSDDKPPRYLNRALSSDEFWSVIATRPRMGPPHEVDVPKQQPTAPSKSPIQNGLLTNGPTQANKTVEATQMPSCSSSSDPRPSRKRMSSWLKGVFGASPASDESQEDRSVSTATETSTNPGLRAQPTAIPSSGSPPDGDLTRQTASTSPRDDKGSAFGTATTQRRPSSPSRSSSFRSKSSNPSSPSPSEGSLLSKSVGQTLSDLQNRYALRRQASQTFKDMRQTPQEARMSSEVASTSSGLLRLTSNDVRSTEATGSSPPLEEGLAARRSSTGSFAGPEFHHDGSTSVSALDVPASLQAGETCLKVSPKKVVAQKFTLDVDRGQILWASKKGNRINLEAIREVRPGSSGSSFRADLGISASFEKRWISVIYQQGGAYKALHLIALSDESFENWRSTLDRLQSLRSQLMGGVSLDQRNSLWLRQHWKQAGSDTADEKLDLEETVRLCRRLGIESSQRSLKEHFDQADGKRGYLDFEGFRKFVGLLKRRPEVEALFFQLADAIIDAGTRAASASATSADSSATQPLRRGISSSAFKRFLECVQGIDPDSCSSVFSMYSNKQHGAVLLEGFEAFLQSADNTAVKDVKSRSVVSRATTTPNAAAASRATAETAEELLAAEARPSARVPPQDMSRPLPEYFISSSHNTYLTGAQWKGDSTVEGYVRALQQGARSVELDCWDGPNGQPIIRHGHSLTRSVLVSHVIAAIGRYAFVASSYPLILSLEIHNGVPQQKTIATVLREILGPALLTEKLATRESASDGLPSLEELRGKILVKTKNPQAVERERDLSLQEPTEAALVTSDFSTSATETGSESDGFFANAKQLLRSARRRDGATSPDEARSEREKVLIAPELASLLIYTVGVKHRGFNKREVYAPQDMISLSEKTAFKYVRDRSAGQDLIKHNRSHLTRTYPSMGITRLVSSANYLPVSFWAMGCHLVALNWQTMDLGFAINQAMFSRNAGCGYVLKPLALRTKDSPTDLRIRCELELTIVSAQQLPRFSDVVQDKEQDGRDVLNPVISITLLTPESWGPQRQDSTRATRIDNDRVSSTSWSSLTLTTFPEQGFVDVGRRESLSQTSTSGSSASTSRGSSSSAPSKSRPRLSPRFVTSTIPGNGWNPIWNESFQIAVEVPAGEAAVKEFEERKADKGTEAPLDPEQVCRGLLDLSFLRFELFDGSASRGLETETPLADSSGAGSRTQSSNAEMSSSSSASTSSTASNPSGGSVASFIVSIGTLRPGYRHLPLFDGQLQQFPFSTLFIRSRLRVKKLVQ